MSAISLIPFEGKQKYVVDFGTDANGWKYTKWSDGTWEGSFNGTVSLPAIAAGNYGAGSFPFPVNGTISEISGSIQGGTGTGMAFLIIAFIIVGSIRVFAPPNNPSGAGNLIITLIAKGTWS